jgi:hypothetical protein
MNATINRKFTMKSNLLISATLLLAGSLVAVHAAPKDDVTAAAKKLADNGNYSWKTTVAVPEGGQGGRNRGPTEGQTTKDGVIHLKMTFGDNSTEAYIKGDKAVVTNPDGGWQTLDELANGEGRGRFMAGMLRSFKAPAAQAAELAGGAKELKKEADAYASELSEERAKALLSFRGGRGGGEPPAVSNAKGSVKFWVTDGALSKYEFKVTGTVNFNGNDREVDRTTTVEIKDVGSTKVEVPEDVKKKLS